MKGLFFAVAVLSLAACASSPRSSSASKANDWFAYRSQMMQKRDNGTLTPVAAEEQIEAKYRQIYASDGPDPEMEGLFAYSKRLYSMAEAGGISLGEADALSSARMDQLLARNTAQEQFHAWMDARFPPNTGD